MSAIRKYLGPVAAALLTFGALAPCASAQGTTGPNVMILLQLAGDSEARSSIGSCLASKLSRMPDVEIAAGPSNDVRFIVDVVAANDLVASLVVAETFPVEQYRLRLREGEDSDALLAGIRSRAAPQRPGPRQPGSLKLATITGSSAGGNHTPYTRFPS